MRKESMSRRSAIGQTGALIGATIAASRLPAAETASQTGATPTGFRICLNTATIRGQKLGIVKEIEVASKAGFDAIEPWVDSINEYVSSGGDLKELKRRIGDSGLTLESAIGFPEWIVDDDQRRAKGMERAKREMGLVAELGGRRFAAPPAGATDKPGLEFGKAVERYRALLEAGDELGIVPQLELWGFSKNLNRLGECVGVAMETGHPKACVLADVFHLYKGGSDIHGIRLLNDDAIQVLHINDYPADVPRANINDSQRVYPGDGSAPIMELLRLLKRNGKQLVVSLEVFNRTYWAQDPAEVARTGVAKIKSVLAKV